MRLFFYLAFRNLLTHPVRSCLVGGSLSAVCALMVVLVSLTAGVKSSLIGGAISLSSGHLNVNGYYKISQGSALPIIKESNQTVKIIQESELGSSAIVTRLKAFGKVVANNKSIQLIIWGINPTEEETTLGSLPVAVDGGAKDPAGWAARGTITLFAAQARKLNVNLGDTVTLALPAYRGGLSTLDLKVSRVLGDVGMLSRFHGYINGDDLRDIYRLDANATGQIMIFLKDPATAASAAEKLVTALTKRGYEMIDDDPAASFWNKLEHAGSEPFIGQRLEVITWRDEITPLAWIIDVFSAFTFVVTLILMSIVILGLTHTQTIAIYERSAETGMMRAIGLSRKKTLAMFFLESMILSTAGCLLGLVLGTGISAILDNAHIPLVAETLQLFLMNNTLVFRPDPTGLIVPFVTIGLFVIAGSLLPAWRAGKMRPGTF